MVEVRVQGEPVTSSDIKEGWAKIVYALEPLTDTLPEPDKSYFRSFIKLLIGKDVSLAYIPQRHMYSFIQQAEYIATLKYYADVIDINYILKEVVKFINRLGLSMSTEGLFIKYGPMGFQQVTQRLQSMGEPMGSTGILRRREGSPQNIERY